MKDKFQIYSDSAWAQDFLYASAYSDYKRFFLQLQYVLLHNSLDPTYVHYLSTHLHITTSWTLMRTD